MKRLLVAIALAGVLLTPVTAQAAPPQRWIYGCYVWQARVTVFNTYLPLCRTLRLPIIAKWVR